MSNFLNGKDYNDYFEKLNNRLAKKEESTENSVKKPVAAKPRKRGFYKTFRLRREFLFSALALALAVALIVILANSCSKKENAKPKQPNVSAEQKVKDEAKPEIKHTAFTEDENTVDLPEDNDAKAGIIVRLGDNKIIASREAHKQVFPASTTKIMTMLTAVDLIENYSDTFTMTLQITDPLYIAESTVAGFLNGEPINMLDLLYGMILPSGGDAAMGLAIKLAGSETEFVKLMNQKAQSLGLKNTHFANVTGLHSEENYSTAYDMAIILHHALQNDICKKILSTYKHTTAKTAQHSEGILLESTLFAHMYGTEPETAKILGGKTGYVNEAGYCVASYGEANTTKEQYIVVTMGNSSKWPAFHGQIALYKKFAK